MKKLLLSLLLLSGAAQAQNAFDVTARARNATNTGYRDDWWSVADVGSMAALMAVDATANRDAVTLVLGSGFTRTGNTLSVSGGSSQVNADWAATSGLPQILNKPDLSIYAPLSSLGAYALTSSLSNYATTASLSAYVTGTTLTSTLSSYASTTSVAAKFATPTCPTTQYLRGDGSCATFPSIPAAQVNSDWSAASGVAQILNKPTIPAAQVNADWNATSGVAQVLNKPQLNVGYGVNRTLALATAYQATDPTKAAVITLSLDCTITGVISVATSCQGEVRVGATTAVATGTGNIAGLYKNSLGLSIINNLGQDMTITVLLPIGGYFAVRQTAGSGLSTANAFDQSIN